MGGPEGCFINLKDSLLLTVFQASDTIADTLLLLREMSWNEFMNSSSLYLLKQYDFHYVCAIDVTMAYVEYIPALRIFFI